MMSEPNLRLNPKVESQVNRILLKEAIKLIIFIVMLLPEREHNHRGRKPYDYRSIIGLCILRIFLRKTYRDYEIEMRTDPRICKAFQFTLLPSKSAIHRGMKMINMKLLYQINFLLLKDQMKRILNFIVDASGIKVVGRSAWYCIRIKEKIKKRDCDKLHLAVCADLLLIMNWRITVWKRHDCPFFKILLKPFRFLGMVFADKGYLSRANFQLCMDKKGCAFIPFKSNSICSPKSNPAWKFAFNLSKKLKEIYKSICNQRSKIESVFSAIKKRFGDKVYCKNAFMRRKEIALRFIAYNIKILICYEYATEHNLPLWVRAKKAK